MERPAEIPELNPPTAWQPLTFGGVAAFARAEFTRLLAVQLVVALVSAGAAAGIFQFTWSPSIRQAISALPAQGGIRNGILDWGGPVPQSLGQGAFLSFVVDPDNTGRISGNTDVEWILTRSQLRIHSLFGYASVHYPAGIALPLNRPEIEPWWGAWSPAILALIVLGGAAGLLLTWWGLALVYMFPVRMAAFFADRPVGWGGAWKLSGAALLPGALFMDAALFGYAFRQLSLLQLLFACAGHFLVGWLFAAVAPARMEKAEGAKQSPFAAEPAPSAPDLPQEPPTPPENPFAS